MELKQIESLLLQEMEEVKGGTGGICECKSGAGHSTEGDGDCQCEKGAALKLSQEEQKCICGQLGGAGLK